MTKKHTSDLVLTPRIIGKITAINSDNTYTVIYNSQTLQNIKSKFGVYPSIGNIVYLVTPNGLLSDVYIDMVLPVKKSSETLWQYTNPTNQAIFSTPIVTTFSNGKQVVIYQGWDWYIYVHDFTTGNLLWRYATGGNCYGRPQAADVNGDGLTEVFCASHDGNVYCLSEAGTLLWTFSNLYTREGIGTVSSAGSYYLIDNTKSWIQNSFVRGTTEGLNASVQIISGTGSGQTLEISGVDVSGNKLWFFNNWTVIPDSTSQYKVIPKYNSDIYYQHAGTLNHESGIWYLYITGFDNQCVKINASNGTLVWKYSSFNNNEPFPTITDINKDGVLECLFVSVDSYVYCLNAISGALIWKTQLGSGCDAFSSFADIDNDGIIEFVVNSRAGRCYILRGDTGVIKYQSTIIGNWQSSEINTKPVLYDINGDGYQEIIFGCYIGYVYCLNYKGETIWRFNQGTTLRGSTNIADINGDGIPEILNPDMTGTISILNPYGIEIGQINMKGSIEGTPLLGDLNNNGGLEIVITTNDGNVEVLKFR